MIVLHQDHVVQAEAMIVPAATKDRVFLEPTPARSRLAGIEDPGVSALNRRDKLSGQSRDPGKPLEKIESDSLGG